MHRRNEELPVRDHFQVAIEAIENIRTVASLTKEDKFWNDFKDLTEPPFK